LVPRGIFLEIKGLAGKTPPGPGGSKAVKFPQFSREEKHWARPIVPGFPK